MAQNESPKDAEAVLERLSKAAGFKVVDINANNAMMRRVGGASATSAQPMVFSDRDSDKDEAVLLNALAVVLLNLEPGAEIDDVPKLVAGMGGLFNRIDERMSRCLNDVIRGDSFRVMERSWRGLAELCEEATADDVEVCFLDCTLEELRDDLVDNEGDPLGSALFTKLYVEEYDRYGGEPFGAMISLFDLDPSDDKDLNFLKGIARVACHAHCPFVAGVAPQFFGVSSYPELANLGGIHELLSRPRYGQWEAFRRQPEAAYVALTLPGYLLRAPWKCVSDALEFEEQIQRVDEYLWGSSAVLCARNMIRSFQLSGWCQHICGPRGGGLIEGLPVHVTDRLGREEIQPPVQVAIPDYRELEFARSGFVAAVHKKDTADVAFFSAQSVKKAQVFADELDTQNANLVCNLAYTLSVTRIAHYVKRMVRDYIGSTADGVYIQSMLEQWLAEYVTTIVNPDDLTLQHYPFKAVKVEVEPKPGPLGWYKCTVSVLPHIQFQGMDVELRLEASLGG